MTSVTEQHVDADREPALLERQTADGVGRLCCCWCSFCSASFGWSYLTAMVADMVPAMDMAEAGPGMGLFNRVQHLFAGLPAEARAALAALCLPAGATFGMPGADIDACGSVQDLPDVGHDGAGHDAADGHSDAGVLCRRNHFGKRHCRRRAPCWDSRSRSGYLAVWLGYALLATAAQWLLAQRRSLDRHDGAGQRLR